MSRRSESSFTEFQQSVVAVPEHGFKLKFNHKFPQKEKFSQNLKPSWKQIWDMTPMFLRYIPYYYRASRDGLPVLMDYIYMENAKGIYGCPMGGIGAGG